MEGGRGEERFPSRVLLGLRSFYVTALCCTFLDNFQCFSRDGRGRRTKENPSDLHQISNIGAGEGKRARALPGNCQADVDTLMNNTDLAGSSVRSSRSLAVISVFVIQLQSPQSARPGIESDFAGVSFQPLPHSEEEDRDRPPPGTVGEADQDLVPEQEDEGEEGEQAGLHD